MRKGRRGALLAGVALALLVLLVSAPMLVQLMRTDAKGSQMTAERTDALALVESGIVKGIRWIDTREGKRRALAGDIPSGFLWDTVYSDVAGGEYKVRISSGPQPHQVTILSAARLRQRPQAVKAAQIVLEFSAQPAVLGLSNWGAHHLTGVELVPIDKLPNVHWGPIYSFAMYTSTDFINRHYPRKYTGNGLFGADTDPAQPNTNDIDYWAYASAPVGPEGSMRENQNLDMEYYRARAAASNVPVDLPGGRILRGTSGTTLAEATPPGSGVFMLANNYGPTVADQGFRVTPDGSALGTGYVFRDPNAVIFLEKDESSMVVMWPALSLGPNTFLEVEAFIAPYPVTLKGPFNGVVLATIPVAADLEYQHPTAAAVWNAGGGSSMNAVFSAGSRCCYQVNNVVLHGSWMGTYLPIVDNGSTRPSIVGTLAASVGTDQMNASSTGIDIYLDNDLGARLAYSPAVSGLFKTGYLHRFRQVSRTEKVAAW